MWWRVTAAEFSDRAGAGLRKDFQPLVAGGRVRGLLGDAGGRPGGWCSVAPRPEFGRILRSPSSAPPAPRKAPVWSIVCFFIDRVHRRTGVAATLLEAAVSWAREQGAAVVEAYPIDLLPARCRPPPPTPGCSPCSSGPASPRSPVGGSARRAPGSRLKHPGQNAVSPEGRSAAA